ncbi:hypothetical protein RAL01_004397, partial [Vibrio vulnificus]|nr:hypothetical protein [Vibrio vulnificus]ELG4952064.1 hypothetical protein [Vibrio vulnificus]
EMRVPEWINTSLSSDINLNEQTLNLVADFTLIWSIFEAAEDDNSGIINRIAKFSIDAAKDNFDVAIVEAPLEFWTNRYVTQGEVNYSFSQLNFRKDEEKDLVSSVLLGRETLLAAKIHAVLLIIYRLRNNLFHGIKDIALLNEQCDNFEVAIKYLQSLLPYGRRYVFLGVTGENA